MSQSFANTDRTPVAYAAMDYRFVRRPEHVRDLAREISRVNDELASARLAAQQQYAEKKQIANRLINLLESLPAAIVVLDDEGVIQECNARAIDLLNQPLMGCAWSVVVQREFCRQGSTRGELTRKDGRRFSLSRSSLAPEQGEILLLADISENCETAKLVGRVERLSRIGEMATRLGHQIKTPLASALLYAQQIADSENTAEDSLKTKLQNCLADVHSTIDSLLGFASGTRLTGEEFLVEDLLREVITSMSPQVQNDRCLVIENENQSLKVRGNFQALKGALINLVCNSLQACGTDPEVSLQVRYSAERVWLTVKDNGPGIDKALQDRVFEPFFTTRPQGTGLGLAVVQSVAEAHQGEVTLDNTSTGAAISIILPTMRAEVS